jgi:hypothetical protein
MTSNRREAGRGTPRRGRAQHDNEGQLERRRAEMHAAEGHAGSIPRGNQDPEQEPMGQRRHEWDRVLGH